MQDLSLLLASKELFLLLSNYKVKTLKQAQQLKAEPSHGIKIVNLINQYQQIKHKVQDKLQSQGNDLQIQKFNKINYQKNPIKYYLSQPCIIEIIGFKGSGKTALCLKLAQIYLQIFKQNVVKIINCAGGITSARLSKFSKNVYSYFDVFSAEDLFQLIQRNKKQTKKGILILDGATNLLLATEKPKMSLTNSLIALRDLGWTIAFTNFCQGRLQAQGKQLINMPAYFPQIFGSLAKYRLLIQPQSDRSCIFKITLLKNLDGRHYQYQAKMVREGITEFELRSIRSFEPEI